MGPAPFRVVLDACVLYPMPLCDTLLRAAHAELYQPCWTAEILGEVTRSLLANGRATPDSAQRRRALMERYFPEADVTGYERLIDAMPNHPKDRHVAAAALKTGAQVIVTANLRDFRPLPEGIEAPDPDRFLCDLLDLSPRRMTAVLHHQAADLRAPSTVDRVLDRLATSAPRFVALMRAR